MKGRLTAAGEWQLVVDVHRLGVLRQMRRCRTHDLPMAPAHEVGWWVGLDCMCREIDHGVVDDAAREELGASS